jgi:NADH-quinone oxidoreductase subunit K
MILKMMMIIMNISKKYICESNKIVMNLDILNIIDISILLFAIGSIGVFVIRRNIIITLISIEMILLACSLNFLVASLLLDDSLGQLYSLLVLAIAGSESAIGLAILVTYYRVRGTISLDTANFLKG